MATVTSTGWPRGQDVAAVPAGLRAAWLLSAVVVVLLAVASAAGLLV